MLLKVNLFERINSSIRVFKRTLKQWYKLPSSVLPAARRFCNLCGYYGYFTHFGSPPRLDVMCPNCCSLERHRLLWLYKSNGEIDIKVPILHFAPESVIKERFTNVAGYYTADLYERADYKENIENLSFKDSSFQTIICNHVLEHVDDLLALKELYRVLAPQGILILSFPYVEGWSITYENKTVRGDAERVLHFGQRDHLRYYGRDVKEKIRECGFDLKEIVANGDEVVRYGLQRGEKIFVCQKIFN